jgi:cobalt/nickel transport system ATP-binding protein
MGLACVEVNQRVDAALEKTGALQLKSRASHRLSGGEKRAVAIATVLSMSPAVLALDEPTSGLDPRARRNLISLLKTFPQTLLTATHDLDFVLEVCDRILVLCEGRLVADDRPSVIFQDAQWLEQNYLELPLCLQRSAAPLW